MPQRELAGAQNVAEFTSADEAMEQCRTPPLRCALHVPGGGYNANEFTDRGSGSMKVAIIDDYQDAVRTLDCFSRLKGHEVTVFNDPRTDLDGIASRLAGFEAVLLTQQRTRITREMLAKMTGLKLISQTGGATAHIDLPACTSRGVLVSAGGAGLSASTAELAWALILASVRHIPFEVDQLRKGKWQTTLGISLRGRTLGVYAYGRIGSIVAQVGKAFGMNVICHGRGASMEKAKAAGFTAEASREAFFEAADIVSLHLPLNADTRGIVKAEDLARMKPTALLVNTSRSGLIGDQLLVDALKKGRPGRAAVDVYDQEPVLNGANPLVALDNVLCTPHLGYVARENYESYYGTAIDQIMAFSEGKPINVANPDVLKK